MSKPPIAVDPDRLPNPTPGEARRDDSLRPLVAALRRLLEAAGPPALPFLRDWPRDLTPRPLVAAAPTRADAARPAAVEAVAALAGDLDWRQT